MGLALSSMGVSRPFLGRTDAGGHLSVRSLLGLGLRPLQVMSLSDVGDVTAPAYSLFSFCLLMAFERSDGLRKL